MDKIIKIQLALFFSEIETRPDRLINYINDRLGNLFDAMPSILPIPADAPPEIPVVILSDLTQRFSCNISRSRVDFIRTIQPYEVASDKDVIIDFYKKSNLFIDSVFSQKKVHRFGFISQYIFHNKNPTLQISRKYLKPDLGQLEELTIRYNKKKEQHGLTLNDIYEITAAKEIDNGELIDGVFIQRDLNNAIFDTPLMKETIINLIDKHISSFQVTKIRELIE